MIIDIDISSTVLRVIDITIITVLLLIGTSAE